MRTMWCRVGVCAVLLPAIGAAQIPGTAAPASAGLPAAVPAVPSASGAAAIPVR